MFVCVLCILVNVVVNMFDFQPAKSIHLGFLSVFDLHSVAIRTYHSCRITSLSHDSLPERGCHRLGKNRGRADHGRYLAPSNTLGSRSHIGPVSNGKLPPSSACRVIKDQPIHAGPPRLRDRVRREKRGAVNCTGERAGAYLPRRVLDEIRR